MKSGRKKREFKLRLFLVIIICFILTLCIYSFFSVSSEGMLYQIRYFSLIIIQVPLPRRYMENHEWNVDIISAPECPKVQTLRLIKTSPFNFELRYGF